MRFPIWKLRKFDNVPSNLDQIIDPPHGHITVATWNLEWASIEVPRGQRIRSILDSIDGDILCLTETFPDMLSADNRTALADADYGYATSDQRRKTALWSRFGWTGIDRQGAPDMPGGRFVAATSTTSIGPIRIIGVCIPWAGAHVRTGRKDSLRWAEHLRFLEGLAEFLRVPCKTPTVVIGDFNQRIPQKWQPSKIYDALIHTIGSDLRIATGGLTGPDGSLAIDHLAHSSALCVEIGSVLPAVHDGLRLSDHFGFTAKITANLR